MGRRRPPDERQERRSGCVERHFLILATTSDFLWKFERENVQILQQMGYTVHYAANLNEPAYLRDREKFREIGVMAHHIEIARSPFLVRDNTRALSQLIRIMRRYGIRTLHCHTPVGGVLGRLAGRILTGHDPVILYTAHGFHFYHGAPLINRSIYYRVEKLLARYTDILILINGEDCQNARQFRLKKGGSIYRIPGIGLDRERFHPLSPDERIQMRHTLGIGEGDFFLLSVGELNDNKNHRIVLDALEQMRREEPGRFNIRYGICGDGFLRDRLADQIRQSGLEDTVALYGHRTDIPQLLGCADASVFPSKREGLGMAGLESLAVGTPVIASDNRGTREYMAHGENGFIFSFRDTGGLIHAIRTMRAMSLEERNAMSARCRACVEPFDKKHTAALMRQIYEDAAQRAARREHGTG